MEQEGVERIESFSFSCHDFNTSVVVFSDGEDSCSDESYIEIAIGPTSTHSFDDRKSDPEDGDKREHQKELELRISFSSSFPLPGLSKTDVLERIGGGSETVTSLSSSTTRSSTSTFGPSSSEEAKYWSAPLGGSSPSKFHKTLKRKLQFPAVNRFLGTLMSGSGELSEVREKSGGRYSPEVATETNQLDLVQGRKTSSIKNRSSSRGAIMKFFMKFKSKNFGALLASMVKPQQFGNAGGKKTRSEETLQRNPSQVTPWDRSLVQMEQGKNRGFEMKMDVIRGVMEAMSTSFSRIDRRTRSRSGSAKSSPIHQGYTSESRVMCPRDSSIQAAIAHCKRSFGQTSDFRL